MIRTLLALMCWESAMGVGIGAGLRLMVPPVPAVPLGVTSIQDSAVNVSTQPGGEKIVEEDPVPVIVEEPSILREHIETVLKVLGTASNIILQLSPLRLVTDMRMHKSAMGFSAAPLLALTACGYQWSFYGYFAFSATQNVAFLTLVYANILGLILGLYYLGTFCVYSSGDTVNGLLRDGLICLFIFMVEGVYCALETDVSKALVCAGLLSAALSILVSCSPMVSLKSAVQTKSIDALPIDIIIASFVSCVLWSLLGILLQDSWVWIPNATGLVVGLVQLLAVAYIVIDQNELDRFKIRLRKFWVTAMMRIQGQHAVVGENKF
jgi:solute carrier family 50 protein (sugar transporter)